MQQQHRRAWPSASPRALSCISAAQCARIAARLAYFSSSRGRREYVHVGMRWRCRPARPMGVRSRVLLGVFSSFSRPGPPSGPNTEPPSAVIMMSAIHVSTACPATAAPISSLSCTRASLAPSSSPSVSTLPAHKGPPAIHRDTPCIDCRPAQPLCRVSPIVTRPLALVRHEARARVYTRDAPAGYLDAKSKHTRTTRRHAAALAHRCSLNAAEPGGSSVQHRSSTRHSTGGPSQTLNL